MKLPASLIRPTAKAITVRQPWAWLIANAGKPFENRNWRTHYRGTLIIHAGLGMTRGEYDRCRRWYLDARKFDATEQDRANMPEDLPPAEELERGGFVAVAESCGPVTGAPLRYGGWFCGPHAILLGQVHRVPFYKFTGARGLFDIHNADRYLLGITEAVRVIPTMRSGL